MLFSESSAREVYEERLSASEIDQTTIVKLWQKASRNALTEPALVELPLQLKGSFKGRSLDAMAWKIAIKKGATLSIELNWLAADSSRLFLDLYDLSQGVDEPIGSYTDQDRNISYEADEDQTLAVRIQPEIFGEGVFTLSFTGQQTYGAFPVSGKKSTAIQSFWGAPRGGGTRTHEGVDIFAAKGTPVVAPTAGIVGSVRNGGLGGKQVWIRDLKRGHNLYFAHLDSQTVSFGNRVEIGDTLGYVGNTGNAKFTPAHLHFGVYDGGAFDPFPLVKTEFANAGLAAAPPIAELMTIASAKVNLRKGAGTQNEIIERLPKGTVISTLAASEDWTFVRTLSGIEGAIYSALLAPVPEEFAGDSLAYASTDLLNASAAKIPIDLKDFKIIGRANGRKVIWDREGNLYFL